MFCLCTIIHQFLKDKSLEKKCKHLPSLEVFISFMKYDQIPMSNNDET